MSLKNGLNKRYGTIKTEEPAFMEDLKDKARKSIEEKTNRHFSLYASLHEQNILNVPVTKPLMIVVLSGEKEIRGPSRFSCRPGSFLFLPDNCSVHMRNIPGDNPYNALLIEFDYADFDGMTIGSQRDNDYVSGTVSEILKHCLNQFVECSTWAPDFIVDNRKKEILSLLYHMGHTDIASMRGKTRLSHQVHDIISKDLSTISVDTLCAQLAMSESTLRRKLKEEGSSVREIKSRARLGTGLHLLQTTKDSISAISDRCGYQSQSRFTQRFKDHFGLTPTELRKTIGD